jgi:hypothetical protein
MKTSAKHSGFKARSITNRSRVTNNAGLLAGVDGRSAAARRYHDLIVAVVNDQGGADRCAEVRLQLIRRFSATSVLAEQLEAAMARGETIDVQQHALLCSSAVRLAQRLGLGRRLKEITPTLAQYLEKAEEEVDE